MGRHERRAELRSFKREAHKASLLTYMVAADADLDGHPLLSRALSYWRGNIQHRRPFCPACKASFADDAFPGAFLLSVPPLAPTTASVTAFCTECWHDLSISDIEREATRVLRMVVPGGKFEPMDWWR